MAQLPVYRYGLIVFAVLLAIPAIVSGNMTQHLFAKVLRREAPVKENAKSMLFNLLIFIGSAGVICFAIFTYAIN